MIYALQYWCLYQPVWREAEGYPETSSWHQAVGLARRLLVERRGNPVRIVDQWGRELLRLP